MQPLYLKNVSAKLPYGRVNLNPVLQDRIIGPAGVTDTTTNVNTPSLQTQLTQGFAEGGTSLNQAGQLIDGLVEAMLSVR